MVNTPQDLVAFGKDNLDAVTTSNQIWVAGLKDLSAQIAASAKASYEESVSTFKALSAVKTPQEAVELQNAYAKTVIANAVAETQKLAEASRKLTEEALAPLTARVTAAVGTFKIG